ncbi:cell division protein FtsQ/DivIB [Corynebacterium doosanense]|uniref:cell division protein FtsQ/DivIB n=1 Tax=Corynebacterium doosanense TaxID=1121358 RepID=UPI000693C113|nr:FtsQ-type POTRA domain-containing protein [Corynebacterium doosanense]
MTGRVLPEEVPEPKREAGPRSNSSSTRWQEPAPAAESGSTPVRRRRRWPWALGVVAVLAVLAGALALAWFVPIFRVSTIAVDGTRQIDQQSVLDASGLTEGENLLRIDTTDAARGVVSLPRVREATVARAFPDTVRIEVVERRVAAWIDDSGQPVLIDERGEPFSDGEPPESAVRLEGVRQDQTEELAGAVAVAAALSDESARLVDHLRVEGPSAYTLHLDDGRTVFWGAPVDNENKAVALETVLKREGSSWNISNPAMVTVR